MCALAKTNAEADLFAPTALLDLYELDSRFISVNGSLYRFTAGVNGVYRAVVFDGKEYTPFPIDISGFEIDGSGGIPRPKLRASNINGFMSQFLLTQGDLVGARLTRIRVFARFIDAVNFPNGINPYGTADPTAAYEPEIYYVNRKVTENPDYVELECVTPFEIDNVKLPNRPLLAIFCPFRYRDPETCGYSGVPVQDRFGKSFTEAAPDGYGYTLNPRGAWVAGDTYMVGDWVSIISEGDFTFGETLVYVCSADNTTGASNNPQFNPTNWIADACPHNVFGCDSHFDSPLPGGFYPGTARANYA
jgi:lambda family phage minor tail protein L